MRGVVEMLMLVLSALLVDLGTYGHTFEIAEPDLLKQITDGVKNLDKQTLIDKVRSSISRPQPVAGVTKATDTKVFYNDPSIIAPNDLKDHTGRIFHKAGIKINPLSYRSLSKPIRLKPIIFIDGDDETQVKWAIEQKGKIVLTSGSPTQLMDELDRPIYFDQGGKLTSKLGIKHVPAIVTQEGMKLKITELALSELVLSELVLSGLVLEQKL